MATAPTNSTSLPSNEVSLAGLSEIELADRAVMPVIDEVVWDGPDDPKNPINWSEKRRLISVVLISIVGFLTPFSSSVSSPATAQIMNQFHSSDEILEGFVTSIFVLGNAVGPLVFGPASEVWGRSIILNTCNVLFTAFTVGCALATSLPMLMVFRFLAGCVGAAPVAIGGGVIADLIPRERRGKAMGIFTAGSLAGPVVGPIAGGYLAQYINWRWSFWLVVIIGGLVSALVLLVLRETHAPTVLKWKAKKLQKQNGGPMLKVPGVQDEPLSKVCSRSIVRPIKMLFLSPITASLAMYVSFSHHRDPHTHSTKSFQALVFGYMYLMFTTFTPTFETQYGFSLGVSGFVYLSLGVGIAIAAFTIAQYSDKIMLAKAAKKGHEGRPEDRLILMIYGAPMVPIGLFWYGWSAQNKLQFMVPIVGIAFVGLGIMSVSLPGNLYMVDSFTNFAASALAAVTFLRSIAGGLIPLAGTPMFNALGVGWGCSTLAFIAVACCPIPFLLTRYGELIRTKFPVRL